MREKVVKHLELGFKKIEIARKIGKNRPSIGRGIGHFESETIIGSGKQGGML